MQQDKADKFEQTTKLHLVKRADTLEMEKKELEEEKKLSDISENEKNKIEVKKGRVYTILCFTYFTFVIVTLF